MFRYVRFVRKASPNEEPRYGILKGFHFSADDPVQVLALEGTPFDHALDHPRVQAGMDPIHLEDIQILSPVSPRKIVGIGLNYKDHAIEQGKPLPEVPYVFLKAVTSLNQPGGVIRINRHCTNVHYEAELAVVIAGRWDGHKRVGCRNVSEREALNVIAGYTVANDVTDRAIQKAELSFARAKGMDTFCPLGPYLVVGPSWENRTLKTWVNGELRQDGNTNDMVHPVPKLISFISEYMTLEPGDVILTGTPKGVGPLKPGDRVRIEIDELGVLENAVERGD